MDKFLTYLSTSLQTILTSCLFWGDGGCVVSLSEVPFPPIPPNGATNEEYPETPRNTTKRRESENTTVFKDSLLIGLETFQILHQRECQHENVVFNGCISERVEKGQSVTYRAFRTTTNA